MTLFNWMLLFSPLCQILYILKSKCSCNITIFSGKIINMRTNSTLDTKANLSLDQDVHSYENPLLLITEPALQAHRNRASQIRLLFFLAWVHNCFKAIQQTLYKLDLNLRLFSQCTLIISFPAFLSVERQLIDFHQEKYLSYSSITAYKRQLRKKMLIKLIISLISLSMESLYQNCLQNNCQVWDQATNWISHDQRCFHHQKNI